jgi:hypothetical protein
MGYALLVKGKGDGSIFNNIKMLINRTVPFTSLLSLPCLYIKLKTFARIIWATAREDVTPLIPM